MVYVHRHVNVQVSVFLNIPQCDQNQGCVDTKAHVNATAGCFFFFFLLFFLRDKLTAKVRTDKVLLNNSSAG